MKSYLTLTLLSLVLLAAFAVGENSGAGLLRVSEEGAVTDSKNNNMSSRALGTKGAKKHKDKYSFFPKINTFLGLWEGIDPEDGGKARRQIICNDDYDCFVLGADSFWGFCSGPLGLQSGPAKKIDDYVLYTFQTLECFNEPKQITGGTPVTYKYIPSQEILIEGFPDLDDTPNIIFHRAGSV